MTLSSKTTTSTKSKTFYGSAKQPERGIARIPKPKPRTESMDDEYEDDFTEDEQDDIVGAIVRRRGRPSRRVRSRASRRSKRSIRPSSARPSAGARAEFPLGFGTHQFANGGATSVILEANPQRDCDPKRLTCVAARTSGAPELLTVTDIKVGTQSQLVSGDAIPFDMFAPDAVGNTLDLAKCGPGVKVYIHVSISAAPGVGETVDITAAMVCDVLD